MLIFDGPGHRVLCFLLMVSSRIDIVVHDDQLS